MNPTHSVPGKTHGPILSNETRGRRGAGEVAGGTAAECTAVFCCLPCTVMNIVVLVVYKVPVGLCRKAIHTYKGKPQPVALKKKKEEEDVLLMERSETRCRPVYYAGTTLEQHLASEAEAEAEGEKVTDVSELGEMDEEMWVSLNGTGFWRSHSQKAVQISPEAVKK